jgi:hypothetical protein
MIVLALILLVIVVWFLDSEIHSVCYVSVLNENRVSDDGNICTDILRFVKPSSITDENIRNIKILKVEKRIAELYYGRTVIRTLNKITGNITYGDNGYIVYLSNKEMENAFSMVESSNIFK